MISSYIQQFSLTGKTAFISASSQGLGLEMALALAKSGAKVYINGRQQEKLNKVIASFPELDLHTFCGDMSDKEEIHRLMTFFADNQQTCDILINNLGLRLRQSWADTEFSAMQHLVESNLLAPMYLSQRMASQMKAGGRIISMSSVAGQIARKGDAIYPITKLGIVAMTRSLAVEYASQEITVNAIAPGAFATESNQALAADPIKGEYMSRRIPMQRWGKPEEIGGLAVFLSSALSSYITGQVLTIDGGLSVLF